jgi:WD40 repeat protein
VVTNVAFSSDSTRICSASLDHSVRLTLLAFSSTKVQTLTQALQVRVWDAERGGLLAFTSTKVQTLTQALQVRVWDAERGGKENALFTDSSEIRACCFSPDGGFVVAV